MERIPTYYCVRRQRTSSYGDNPGEAPCPDQDKCHLCGKGGQREAAPKVEMTARDAVLMQDMQNMHDLACEAGKYLRKPFSESWRERALWAIAVAVGHALEEIVKLKKEVHQRGV